MFRLQREREGIFNMNYLILIFTYQALELKRRMARIGGKN